MEKVLTVAMIKTMFEQVRIRQSKLRDRMAQNYRYVIGDQLSSGVKEQLRKDRRPELVFNLTHNVILTVAGHIAGNTSKMRAKPLRMGDENLAGIHTVVTSDWGIGDSGYYEIAKAGVDAAIGGIGWVNQNWDLKEDPQGRPDVSCYDPFMVWIDGDARRIDQKDWRYLYLSGWYGVEDAIRILDVEDDIAEKMREKASQLEGRAVDSDAKEVPVSWAERTRGAISELWNKGREETGASNAVRTTSGQAIIGTALDYEDVRAGLYRVIEMHDKRTVRRLWIYDMATNGKEMIPAGQEMDEAVVVEAMKKYARPIRKWITSEQIWKVGIVPALLPNKLAMERPYEVQGKGFKLKPIFCYDWHPDLLEVQSIMDAMISPSDSFNQRQMSMLEWLLKAVNPNIVAPRNSIDPMDMDDWKSKDRGKILIADPVGGSMPVEQVPNAAAVQIMGQLSQEHAGMLPKLTGVTPAMAGFSENATEAASYYTEKVRTSLVNLAYLNRHIQEGMKGVFKYTDALCMKYITQPRAVRLLYEPTGVTGEGVEARGSDADKVYWLKLNWPTIDGVLNDYTQGDYDWYPDTMAMGATEKQLKYLEGLQLMKVLDPADRDIVAPFVIEQWDNPMSKTIAGLLKQRRQQSEEQNAQAQEMQQQAAQIQLQQQATRAQAEKAKLMLLPAQIQQQRLGGM